MSTVLGANNYGKAEIRLVRIGRETPEHQLVDLNVSVALAGHLSATHLTGDNSAVLPTDTQKNTVYAFARQYGVDQLEAFGLRLARHFVDSQPTITRARVDIAEYAWRRLGPHSFARNSEGVRTASVTVDGDRAWVVSGVDDLVLLNSTGSEFHGFIRDAYTTLPETTDRILATAVRGEWRHDRVATDADTVDWNGRYDQARAALVDAFTTTHSLSLQQTLHAMGAAVLATDDDLAEVRFSLPNRHHFLVDLSPFALDNPGEVFIAADRPYGLIEGTVLRAGAEAAPLAWSLAAV